MRTGNHISDWTHEAVVAECRAAYRAYHKELRERHTAYFNQRSNKQSKKHAFAASKREYAFADNWGKLATLLPDDSWHLHHLAGVDEAVTAQKGHQSVGAREAWHLA